MLEGRVVAGKYRIESKLGEGGFGAVFRALDVRRDERVALKLLHVDALLRDETRARFRREARLAQSLSHRHVVRLLDYGETDDGIPFIAWELLEGRTLEAALRADGPLSLDRVAAIAAQILDALSAAHEAGIVHRDVKPANVFLLRTTDGSDDVRVLDFGIAAVGSELASQTLTREGTTVGTPAYMSPEQVLAEPLDGRADLYSVGLLMAECLSGRPVYRGETAMRIALDQASPAPPPIPSEVLATPLGPMIARATEKDRARRFASAREMQTALEGLPAARSKPRSAVSNAPEPAPRARATHGSWVAAAILTLGILAVGLTGWVLLGRRAPRAPTTATCAGNARASPGCTFHGRSLADLDPLMAKHGYERQELPVRRPGERYFLRGSTAVVVLLGPEPGQPVTGSKGVVRACSDGCYLTIALTDPSLTLDARQRAAEDLVAILTP